ncbi:MAG: arginine--tRNA ligase [Pseudomonadota bacterium]
MTLLDDLSARVGAAFAAEGLEPDLGKVRVSDRPDLAQFQCNGALAAAKQQNRNPREIAGQLADRLQAEEIFREVTIAGPGFLNLALSDAFLADRLCSQSRGTEAQKENGAVWQVNPAEKIVLDYGGPNVAKPLHVGHLRAAIIGESLKRLFRYVGHTVIGDVHFGDWGLQMGQLISELENREPALPYFDTDKTDGYPDESPVTLADLEAMYPVASAACKTDPERRAVAQKATFDLQAGRPGYRALWQHFVAISRAAIEAEYDDLAVTFDWWKGESDAHPQIDPMVSDLRAKNLAEDSDGAVIVRVKRETDRKDVPPVMLVTSEGSAGYHTTDIATIIDRKEAAGPDRMIYVVDQRQALHFEQVFRAAHMAGYFPETHLEHLGFGTMNGKDGKPFKTREGGVLKLRDMIDMVTDKARERIEASGMGKGEEAATIDDIAHKVGIAALKFADLSNPRTSDYVFDLDRFTAFEGKTGPYLLYASVRIRSMLAKADPTGETAQSGPFQLAAEEERELALSLLKFDESLRLAVEKRMPHIIAEHAYGLAQAFSRFYTNCRVNDEPNKSVRASRIKLAAAAGEQLDQALDLLGISVPTRM